jgi:hypothetical protein
MHLYTPGYQTYCDCLATIAYARSEFFYCADCYISFYRQLLRRRA